MSEIPSHLKYTKDHEWVQTLDDGTALVGVTDHAQASLGDVTFVEMPTAGDHFNAGETFGVVESVKAASDLFMPVGATVLEVNPKLEDEPELVNQSPYEAAWMLKIQIDEGEKLDALLSPEAYRDIAG